MVLSLDVPNFQAYSKNTNAGTATVTITGTGGYTGTATKNFIINPKSISSATVTLSPTSYIYDGAEKKPSVTVKDGTKTLTLNTDYTVKYDNNINPGTATVTVSGENNYTDFINKTFTITEPDKPNISNCTITLSPTSYTYDGTKKEPSVTVKNNSTTLTSGTDYTLAYSNNINEGTASVTISGKGGYTGSATKSFTINAKSLSSAAVSLSETVYTYDASEKKPTVTVKDGSKTLTNGTDYTLSYTNNKNVGTATVTVTGKGNYSGTATKNYSISESEVKEFKWGLDNWNFNNSSAQGYFANSTYRKQINTEYLNVLKNNLTNSEYQAIFVGSWYSNAWLDEWWGGSCYGMSSTTLLAKEGLLPYSSYKTGASKLHDLSYPKNDSMVSSLVTYYQMLQIKDVIQQQYRTVPYRSNSTNIKEIITLLDSHSTVLLGFQKSGWGGHAILATGYEYGSWTWGGISYQGCIKICDPNNSLNYDKKFNIYFNTQSYNWTIPAYSGMTSASGAKFNYIGATVSDINKGGYLLGNSGNRIGNFVARIDAAAIADNRSVTKVRANNGSYINMNTAPGDIIEDYSYVLGNESAGTIGYNLFDATESYKVSQDSSQELQLTIDYEDCNLSAGSKAGNSILFDQEGYIEVRGESAAYNFEMTYDDSYPTDWFTIQVKGNGADFASLKQVENGYVLISDSLNDVEIKANNFDDPATISFSTEYDSVFVYEINKTTIGLKVDTDGNGTYETELTQEHQDVMLGDVNGDGKVTIDDATLVQKAIAEMISLNEDQKKAADTNGDGDITIDDATMIQKYVAELIDHLG